MLFGTFVCVAAAAQNAEEAAAFLQTVMETLDLPIPPSEENGAQSHDDRGNASTDVATTPRYYDRKRVSLNHTTAIETQNYIKKILESRWCYYQAHLRDIEFRRREDYLQSYRPRGIPEEAAGLQSPCNEKQHKRFRKCRRGCSTTFNWTRTQSPRMSFRTAISTATRILPLRYNARLKLTCPSIQDVDMLGKAPKETCLSLRVDEVTEA